MCRGPCAVPMLPLKSCACPADTLIMPDLTNTDLLSLLPNAQTLLTILAIILIAKMLWDVTK